MADNYTLSHEKYRVKVELSALLLLISVELLLVYGKNTLEVPDGLSADQRMAGHAAPLHRHLVHLPPRCQKER